MNRMPGKPEMKTAANKSLCSDKAATSDNSKNKADKKPDIKVDIDINLARNVSSDFLDLQISHRKLQEAIIWSELLGKPVCKRRKRRM